MKIEEVIVNGEKVYLKKDRLGWHEVHPIKKDITQPIRIGKKINWKNINWKNLISGGSWIKLGIVFFIILIICGCIYEYSTAVRIANECIDSTRLYIPLN